MKNGKEIGSEVLGIFPLLMAFAGLLFGYSIKRAPLNSPQSIYSKQGMG